MLHTGLCRVTRLSAQMKMKSCRRCQRRLLERTGLPRRCGLILRRISGLVMLSLRRRSETVIECGSSSRSSSFRHRGREGCFPTTRPDASDDTVYSMMIRGWTGGADRDPRQKAPGAQRQEGSPPTGPTPSYRSGLGWCLLPLMSQV